MLKLCAIREALPEEKLWKAISCCCRRQSFDYVPGGWNCLTLVLSSDSQAVLTVTVFHHVVGVAVFVWEAVASAPAMLAYRQGVLARVRRLLFKGHGYIPGSFCMCVDVCIYTQIKAFLESRRLWYVGLWKAFDIFCKSEDIERIL